MWNFIAAAMNGGCQSFFQNESYIRQQPAPLAIYPLRVRLGAGVHLLLGCSWSCISLRAYATASGNLGRCPRPLPALALLFIFGWSLADPDGRRSTSSSRTRNTSWKCCCRSSST